MDSIAADLTLGKPWPISGPLVAAGTSPHLIITPSDSCRACALQGTLCVAATLNRGGERPPGVVYAEVLLNLVSVGNDNSFAHETKGTSDRRESELSAHCDKAKSSVLLHRSRCSNRVQNGRAGRHRKKRGQVLWDKRGPAALVPGGGNRRLR